MSVPPSIPYANLTQPDPRLPAKKIRRAISVATFDGWTLAIFGALTLVCGFSSPSGLLVGIGMGLVAANEFRGLKMLKRLDPRAASVLGWNQIFLGAILFLYAVWRIYQEFTGPGMFAEAQAMDPMVADMMKPFEPLGRLITMLVYGTLIAVAIFAQGGTAWFYFTREKYIREYLQHAPPELVRMQQSGMTI